MSFEEYLSVLDVTCRLMVYDQYKHRRFFLPDCKSALLINKLLPFYQEPIFGGRVVKYTTY